MSYCVFSGVATPETAMGITMQLPRGCLRCLSILTLLIRDATMPLVRSKAFHPAHYDLSQLGNHHGARQKNKNNPPPGTLVVLAHAGMGMFYGAVAPTNAIPNIHTMLYSSVGANRVQLLHLYLKGEGVNLLIMHDHDHDCSP